MNQESRPKLSVLMTAYNRENFISEAIESVLASTFTDFELIIVDDVSQDLTLEIAKSYENLDQRVKVYANDTNLGDYPNRNQAAAYASGKYIKYVDADDYIYPWGLETLVTLMETFPLAAYGLCSLEQNKHSPFPILLSPKEAYTYHYFGPGLFYKAPLSSIIRLQEFNQLGGFSHIRMAGDFDMWHRMSREYFILLMPHGVVWYREHSEQEMSSYEKYKHVYTSLSYKYVSNGPFDENEKSRLLRKWRKETFKQLAKSIIKLNLKKIIQEFRKLKLYSSD